jgi:hypothetical protein
MKGRQLLQHIIDTSDVALAKKQEATEYLAKLVESKRNSSPQWDRFSGAAGLTTRAKEVETK